MNCRRYDNFGEDSQRWSFCERTSRGFHNLQSVRRRITNRPEIICFLLFSFYRLFQIYANLWITRIWLKIYLSRNKIAHKQEVRRNLPMVATPCSDLPSLVPVSFVWRCRLGGGWSHIASLSASRLAIGGMAAQLRVASSALLKYHFRAAALLMFSLNWMLKCSFMRPENRSVMER